MQRGDQESGATTESPFDVHGGIVLWEATEEFIVMT